MAGPLGGYLAGRAFGLTAGLGAMLMALLVVVAWRLLREPATAVRNTAVWRNAGNHLKGLARSRTLWAAVLMNVLFYIAPGFTTPLLFYQTNTLHFSGQFIGNLAVAAGIFGIIGSLIYMRVCRMVPLRTTMYVAVICSGIGSLCYALYSSHMAAIVIESNNGLMAAVATLALFDLSARATPAGGEAVAYSLMMAASNHATSLSDVFGSAMYDKHGWTFMNLVWLNGLTTFLILLVVPFLPKALVSRRDAEVEEAMEVGSREMAADTA